MNSHTTWRPASTVILLNRRVTRRLSVMLLKRPAAMRAFPGFWAFPGGRVDPDDSQPIWKDRIAPDPGVLVQQMLRRDQMRLCFTTEDYLSRMQVDAPPLDLWMPKFDQDQLWAHWVAAVREVYEEIHISVGGWGSTPDLLNFTEMMYLGRLAPPPAVPQRFDTRFFAAAIEPEVPRPSALEADDARWLDVEEVLAGAFPLANPTRYALLCLADLGNLEAVMTNYGRPL